MSRTAIRVCVVPCALTGLSDAMASSSLTDRSIALSAALSACLAVNPDHSIHEKGEKISHRVTFASSIGEGG